MVDPIADLLTRIRNAGMARHVSLRVPTSKVKLRLVEILREEGYVESFSVEDGAGPSREILIHLRYVDGTQPAIRGMRRVSKPGRRQYFPGKDLVKVRSGLGIAIVSTSKGVLTDRDARRLNVGGEVLCEVW
jgi:small subunit ribosomal protein S8